MTSSLFGDRLIFLLLGETPMAEMDLPRASIQSDDSLLVSSDETSLGSFKPRNSAREDLPLLRPGEFLTELVRVPLGLESREPVQELEAKISLHLAGVRAYASQLDSEELRDHASAFRNLGYTHQAEVIDELVRSRSE